MEQENRVRNIGQWLEQEEVLPQRIMIRSYTQEPQPGMSLESIEESLTQAYLAANLRSRHIPLKAFMDDLEKRILVSCLRLAQGNQKNVAAVLSVKPTSLFEKLRRHGIRPRQRRPSAPVATTATDQIA